MDLKDIIPTRQTAKRRKNRQRISFAETGVSLEACRRQRQKFRSKNLWCIDDGISDCGISVCDSPDNDKTAGKQAGCTDGSGKSA